MWTLCVLLFLFYFNLVRALTPIVIQQDYSDTFTSYTINSTVEHVIEFKDLRFKALPEKLPPRITIQSKDAVLAAPLMVVARQPKQITSWQLPLSVSYQGQDIAYNEISRTLCHDISGNLANEKVTNPYINVATVSTVNVTYEVKVNYQKDFFVQSSVEKNVTISPSEPMYFYYNFETNASNVYSNYDTVILEVFSPDSICMTVSIQNVSCPVFQTDEDVTFRGFYETVNRKGGITIPKYKFPFGFYVVFVAKSDDSDCTQSSAAVDKITLREKQITFIVKPSITYSDYVRAVIVTLISIGGFYFVFGVAFFVCSLWHVPRQMQYVTDNTGEASLPCPDDAISHTSITSFDRLPEVESDRHLRLTKPVVFLTDLAQKDPRVISYRSYLYLYNVLTVAIFYGLPVVQLVITYQNVLNQTGQQDLCYYNFLCAHPFGFVSDFNHVFSNIGYILLGFLFLWITYRREISHRDLEFDRQYGIPQHYGMFYAMGVALIMEGILSGSYHICPNKANFQFDSSFMYVMAVLCMVKLYQNRHPDINATAYATFGVLAVAIFLGLIGILEGSLYFYICFSIIYIITCFYLSAQIYYMGCWKLDRGLVFRVYRTYVNDYRSGIVNLIKPTHKARMCFLIVGNLVNYALAGLGIYYHQTGFAIYLLGIFMCNTLLYFFFYILMKYIHRERVTKLALVFLSLSVICAISAMYFFVRKSINWAASPAESRQFNRECQVLKFYDFHDIWHFLSAIGMFFTFMVLLTLDDDVSHKHRSQIYVF